MKISAGLEVILDVIAAGFKRADNTPVVFDDDIRLTNTRTPVNHASTHAAGQADQILPSTIGAATEGHTHPELHEHTNKTVLDKFSQSGEDLLFNGNPVGGGGGATKKWIDYVTGYTVTPTIIADTAERQIWQYQYSALTLFREITATTDIFYGDYTEGTLSNVIANKQF